MTNASNGSRSGNRLGVLGNPYVVGLVAAIVIGVAAAVITRLLDDGAPAVLIGVFFAVLAFLAGAGGRARMGRGVTPDETMPSRWS
jgi:cation transporter-like permease